MTEPGAIGGYFSLEQGSGKLKFGNAFLLNSGHAGLELLLRHRQPRLVYLPCYTCQTVVDTVIRCGPQIQFYQIDHGFEPLIPDNPPDDALVLLTNYFGLLDHRVDYWAGRLENVVIDNAQAFYATPPQDVAAFSSPRKFFGVPDGGLLWSTEAIRLPEARDKSFTRMAHLLHRIEEGPESGYREFQAAEAGLGSAPAKRMSAITQQLLSGINLEMVRQARLANYRLLHEKLGALNECRILAFERGCPMVYPFLYSRRSLHAELAGRRIFVPRYWPDVLERCNHEELWERTLTEHLLPLPIDQRYGDEDMHRIIENVTELIGRDN